MLIGLTYDLKEDYEGQGLSAEQLAELDRIETTIGIEGALHAQGFKTERVGHAKALLKALSEGRRWDLVFNLCEGLHGIGREAQVPAILDLYQIPYTFSDTAVLGLCLHKGLTKHVVRDAGVPTPDFAVVSELADIEDIDLPYPLFTKPVAEGTGKGIYTSSRVETKEQLVASCESLLKTFRQPVLVETFLPGREFTVGMIGSGREARVLGVMEVIFVNDPTKNAYGYENKSDYIGKLEYSLAEGSIARKCGNVALRAWRALGCLDGGRIDVRLDAKGRAQFLEVNPLAGLTPHYSDLANLSLLVGLPYEELIGGITRSALTRAGLARECDSPIFRLPTKRPKARRITAAELINPFPVTNKAA